MIFKAGDVVRVVNDVNSWRGFEARSTGPFTVKATSRIYSKESRIYGAGHWQHLSLTDGTEASGYWFDPDFVGLSVSERSKLIEVAPWNRTFEQWWVEQAVHDDTVKELCLKTWLAAKETA